jgi:hypothetical protein
MYYKEQQELERRRFFEKLDEDSTIDVKNTSFSPSPEMIDIETNDNNTETIMNEGNNYLHLKFQCQDETIEKLKVKKVSFILCIGYVLVTI